MSHRGGDPSAATGHCPAEGSGRKCTGAQNYYLQLQQVFNACVCVYV